MESNGLLSSRTIGRAVNICESSPNLEVQPQRDSLVSGWLGLTRTFAHQDVYERVIPAARTKEHDVKDCPRPHTWSTSSGCRSYPTLVVLGAGQ